VLEVDRVQGTIVRHYPPNRVKALLAGPELVLTDGRRLGLDAFRSLPFEAPWSDLKLLREVEEALGPYSGYRPYWSLWAAQRTDEEALRAMGRDLLMRGHRVELAWGEDYPFDYLVRAATAAREQGIEESLALTRFLFDYVPLFPGSEAFFQEAADWFWAQGQRAEAERLRAGVGYVSHYRRYGLENLFAALLVFFAIAYLALLLKALFAGGRPLGARLPFAERLLLVVLLFALAAGSVGYLLSRQVTAELDRGFSRASLKTLAAKEAVARLPEGPERDALLHGKGADVPSAALRLLAGRPAAALAWDRDSGAVLEALELGGDPWSAVYAGAGVSRPPVPSDRELELMLARARGREFLNRPFAALSEALSSPLLVGLAAFLAAVLLLVHLLALFRGAPGRPGIFVRLLELLVPGLVGFGAGVGLFLLGAALYGAWRLLLGDAQGAFWLGGAYLINLVWLAASWKGAKA